MQHGACVGPLESTAALLFDSLDRGSSLDATRSLPTQRRVERLCEALALGEAVELSDASMRESARA
jgi:hypothetical protein